MKRPAPDVERFLFLLREEALAGEREGADQEHPAKPDQDGDEDRDGVQELFARIDRASERWMLEDRDRDRPPGQHGVQRCRNQPGCEEPPGSESGVFRVGIGSQKSGNASKVDPAEGGRQQCRPAETEDREVAEQVFEGEFAGREVEDLERHEGSDNQKPEDEAAVAARGEAGIHDFSPVPPAIAGWRKKFEFLLPRLRSR